jgi:hypothetical protein
MKEQDKRVQRRDFLRQVTAGIGLAVGSSGLPHDALASDGSTTADKKRQSRYQPNSLEVQDFYRVNGYPPGSRGSSC